MLTLSGFVTVAVLLLPHIGEQQAKAAASETAQPPGNVMIEARWPDAVDADVDLWVQAPGDVPVGYSNKGGAIFNLLRDDLGTRADATGLNYEISFARGLPAGEYTANLHLYRNQARGSRAGDGGGERQGGGPAGFQADSGVVGGADARGSGDHGVPFPARRRRRAGARQRDEPAKAPARRADVMIDLTPLFALTVLLAVALATICIWSHRHLPLKVGALALAFALMGTAYGAMLDLLSKPKPASFEWFLDNAGEATVLGSSMVEDEAIYVWLQLEGVGEPRAYRATLGPAHGRAAAGGDALGGRAADRAAHADAVREVARRSRAPLLCAAATGLAAQGCDAPAGDARAAARDRSIARAVLPDFNWSDVRSEACG